MSVNLSSLYHRLIDALYHVHALRDMADKRGLFTKYDNIQDLRDMADKRGLTVSYKRFKLADCEEDIAIIARDYEDRYVRVWNRHLNSRPIDIISGLKEVVDDIKSLVDGATKKPEPPPNYSGYKVLDMRHDEHLGKYDNKNTFEKDISIAKLEYILSILDRLPNVGERRCFFSTKDTETSLEAMRDKLNILHVSVSDMINLDSDVDRDEIVTASNEIDKLRRYVELRTIEKYVSDKLGNISLDTLFERTISNLESILTDANMISGSENFSINNCSLEEVIVIIKYLFQVKSKNYMHYRQ